MNRTADPISRLSRTLALLLVCWCSLIHAQVPHQLNYQGYLTNPSGAAINNASLSLTFKLYTVASGGTELYGETQSVIVINGIFNALIGSVAPLTLAFDQPYFIGISAGGDTEMTPRQPLAASPYAIRSASSESLAATALIAASNLPATQLLPTVACATNQIPQWNGSAWICATVSSGSGSGTVSNVATGAGLTGGPISTTGTISIAPGGVTAAMLASNLSLGGTTTGTFSGPLTGNVTGNVSGSAASANTATTATTALFSAAPWVTSGSNLYYNAGSIGIGTANPQVPLEVITTAGTGNAFEVTSLGGAPAIYGRRANGTTAAPSNVQLGNTVAVFAARGYGASAYGSFTGYMDFQATENWTNTAQGTRLRFFTPASGSNSPQQRMVIDHNGNVGIGATIPGSTLTVAGTIESTSGGVKFPDSTLQTTAATKTAYQNVKVVAKSGGDFTTISAALAAITDNTATNRYLVYVAPGTYTEQVTMKPYVDIEGAGELPTRINFASFPSANSGTVLGASNAELRFLTVENTGGPGNAIAIYNNLASPRLTHVTLSLPGGNASYGIISDTSSMTLNNVIITGASSGITNNTGSGIVRIINSQISGSAFTLAQSAGYTTTVVTSQLSGGGAIFNSGGSVTCVFSYGSSYAALNAACL